MAHAPIAVEASSPCKSSRKQRLFSFGKIVHEVVDFDFQQMAEFPSILSDFDFIIVFELECGFTVETFAVDDRAVHASDVLECPFAGFRVAFDDCVKTRDFIAIDLQRAVSQSADGDAFFHYM
ncbi:hypothetical protein R1flu_028216 [Riccia fluitans]|uniref:Uncharacterized protein n=1 Tax=Riccia fluitans TaxID=41844 RepID=A0ABD1XQ27_9MARC